MRNITRCRAQRCKTDTRRSSESGGKLARSPALNAGDFTLVSHGQLTRWCTKPNLRLCTSISMRVSLSFVGWSGIEMVSGC